MSILYLDIAIVYSQYGNLCMLVFYLYVAILRPDRERVYDSIIVLIYSNITEPTVLCVIIFCTSI